MTTESSSNNPLILAIETSGRMGSVALAAGEKLLGEQQFSGPMRHSAEVFGAIVGLLEQFGKKPIDIEQVYVSVGPGSFTGLRIGVTIAKTMALANNAGIVAVDTLDVIAANAAAEPQENRGLAVILDAKRGQFFIAVYDNTGGAGWKKILPDCLMTAGEFLTRFADSERPVWLLGEGLVYYKDSFAADGVQFFDEGYWVPSAANVHRFGWQKAQRGDYAEAIRLTPNYLRGPDVKLKGI